MLSQIVETLKVTKSECVYVGDSPTKDVAMAQDVGISDVYAKYGRAQHTEATISCVKLRTGAKKDRRTGGATEHSS